MNVIDYARIGARTRYTELSQEMRTILRQFPGIERDVREATGRVQSIGRPVKKKTRRTMSAKARAAISAAQKARWAAQRAPATPTEGAEPTTPVAAPKRRRTRKK